MPRQVSVLDFVTEGCCCSCWRAETIAVLADEQRIETPPEAEAVNKALVANFRALDAALPQGESAASLDAATGRLGEIEAELERIALECGLGRTIGTSWV